MLKFKKNGTMFIKDKDEAHLVYSIKNVDGTNHPRNNVKNMDRPCYPGSKVEKSRSRAQSDNSMCTQNTEPHHLTMDIRKK